MMNGRQLIGAVLLAIAVIPYLQSVALPQPRQSQPSLAQKPSWTTQPSIRSSNVWKRVLGRGEAPAPWKVFPCQGIAPLLCVSYEGKLVGTVEMGVHPLESRADFKERLKAAGLASNPVNIQNSKNRDRLVIALKDWVADYYTFFKRDRKIEYGDQMVFATQTPQVLTVGGLTGVSYGFSGLKKVGGVYEQRLGYVAFDGRILYVITTAFDPGSSTGSFRTLEDLQRFEPYLKGVVARLQLPFSKR